MVRPDDGLSIFGVLIFLDAAVVVVVAAVVDVTDDERSSFFIRLDLLEEESLLLECILALPLEVVAVDGLAKDALVASSMDNRLLFLLLLVLLSLRDFLDFFFSGVGLMLSKSYGGRMEK